MGAPQVEHIPLWNESEPAPYRSGAIENALERLTQRYRLKRLVDGRRIGLRDGVAVAVRETEGQIGFTFSATGAEMGHEIANGFKGMTYCVQAGIASEWFTGDDDAPFGCGLIINEDRLRQLGMPRFLNLLEPIAQDFHQHGGYEEFPCNNRGTRPAVTTVAVDYNLVCLCRPCWKETERMSVNGDLRIADAATVRWEIVAPRSGISWFSPCATKAFPSLQQSGHSWRPASWQRRLAAVGGATTGT